MFCTEVKSHFIAYNYSVLGLKWQNPTDSKYIVPIKISYLCMLA